MRDGFVRVAAGTPLITLADAEANAKEIISLMNSADAAHAKLLVLPELSITGASCQDLFYQTALCQAALSGLQQVVSKSASLDVLTILGMPLRHGSALFNCAVAVKGGQVLGVIPKSALSREERRWFTPARVDMGSIDVLGQSVPMHPGLVLRCAQMPMFSIAVQFDGATPQVGANVLAMPAAKAELVGVHAKTCAMLSVDSARQMAAIVMASTGPGESTTDMVYGGRRAIYECGRSIAQSGAFDAGLLMTELDLGFLESKRCAEGEAGPRECGPVCEFSVRMDDLALTRDVDPAPFTPDDPAELAARCEEILDIQAEGLAERMRRIHCAVPVLGVSGGLDSTLAMLVSARALKRLGLPSENLHAITMPCFGTSDRTKGNAHLLCECLGSELREIDITASVAKHLDDIGHPLDLHDAAFENSQARERTQVLMDIANMEGGLVVGTGDLSELALGWATYNGDHMCMYSVNSSVPKTLVRHLVRHAANLAESESLRDCLLDILDTPISPELLPPVDGKISQVTENVVGPYELHDFFLYHMLRRMATPRVILRLAIRAFAGVYDEATIDKWLNTFLRRFFSQQFKRNCMPEGVGIGSLSLSPRGAYSMPGDAQSAEWINNLHNRHQNEPDMSSI